MGSEVRVNAGVPSVANFALGPSSPSTPIVIDSTSGIAYYLAVGNTVTPLASAGGSSVTSVNVSGGTTGLTFTGGPVTSSGTITASGTLGVANGGTGATTFAAGDILFGNGTSAIAVDANLTWSATTGLLTQKGISSKGAANGIGTELFGLGASDAGTSSTTNNTVVGSNASVTASFNSNSTVIGAGASTSTNNSVVIGAGTSNSGGEAVVIGSGQSNAASGIVVIGQGNLGSNSALLAIGQSVNASHSNAGVLGRGGQSQKSAELSWGSRSSTAGEAPSFRLYGTSASVFNGVDSFQLDCPFIDATLATFKVRNIFSTYDAGGTREYMRADANGGGADVFFNGNSVSIAGAVSFGVFTTSALAPVTGYIAIKDNTGNVRHLACV